MVCPCLIVTCKHTHGYTIHTNSLVPRPHPAFRRYQYGKAGVCSQLNLKRSLFVLKIFAIFRLRHAHMRKDTRFSILHAFPYCKRRKAGRGLGTHAFLYCKRRKAGRGLGTRLTHKHVLIPVLSPKWHSPPVACFPLHAKWLHTRAAPGRSWGRGEKEEGRKTNKQTNKQTNKKHRSPFAPSFLFLTQYCMWRLTFLTALWQVFPPVLLSLLSAVRLLSALLAAWKDITIRLEVTPPPPPPQLESVTVLWDHQEQLALTFPLSLHW